MESKNNQAHRKKEIQDLAIHQWEEEVLQEVWVGWDLLQSKL